MSSIEVTLANFIHLFAFCFAIHRILLKDFQVLLLEDPIASLIRSYFAGKSFILHELLSRLLHLSIDQGPFEFGTTRDALGTTPEGGILLGPERPRTYEDLSDTEKKRYDADVRATSIVLQGLPKDIYKLINHRKTQLKVDEYPNCHQNRSRMLSTYPLTSK
ncbi:hypothetical protein Tco_1408470 [Tanacetum coccineum]